MKRHRLDSWLDSEEWATNRNGMQKCWILGTKMAAERKYENHESSQNPAKWTDIESKFVGIVDSGPTNATDCNNMEFLETKMAAVR